MKAAETQQNLSDSENAVTSGFILDVVAKNWDTLVHKYANSDKCRHDHSANTDLGLPLNELSMEVDSNLGSFKISLEKATEQPDDRDICKTTDTLMEMSYQERFDVLKNMVKKCLQHIKRELFCKDSTEESRFSAMNWLRRIISYPLYDGSFVKLKESDYKDVITIALEVNISQLVSDIILHYERTGIKSSDVNYVVDAFWVLTNISSGERWQTQDVIKAGSIPFALHIIENSDFIDLVSQSLMLVTNAVIDDVDVVHKVLNGTIFSRLKKLLPMTNNLFRSNIFIFYYSIVRTKADLDLRHLTEFVHQAMSVLYLDAPITVIHAAFDLLAEATKFANLSRIISLFHDFGYEPKLTAFMAHTDLSVRSRCLKAVGNLALGTDEQTWPLLKTSLLQHLIYCLYSEETEMVKNALWTLSNVVAGEPEMLDCFFDYDFLPCVLYYVTCEEKKLVIEALWTLKNLFAAITKKQFHTKLLYNIDIIKAIFTVLGINDDHESDIKTSPLEYIDQCLDVLNVLINFAKDLTDNSEKHKVKEMYNSLNFEKCLVTLKVREAKNETDMEDQVNTILELYKFEFLELEKNDESD